MRAYLLYINNVGNFLQFRYSVDGTLTAGQYTEFKMDTAFDADDLGVWIHLAVTVDVSAQSILFYKDGSSAAATSLATGATAIQNGTAPFAIGDISIGGTPSWFFDGSLDDIRVWNDIRTSTEISDNMSVELTGSEANLVAYWPFETVAPPVTGIASMRQLVGVGQGTR